MSGVAQEVVHHTYLMIKLQVFQLDKMLEEVRDPGVITMQDDDRLLPIKT